MKEKEAVYKYQGKEGKKSNVGDWEMPKLGNSYNLQREACYEASLPTFFSVF